MLSIMDPVELEGLVLFRDDEDPRKFYLLPDRPTLSKNESGAPDFLFIKYKRTGETAADDKAGGYLQFRSTLTVDDDRQQRVIAGLRAQLQQDQAAGRKPFGNAITSTEPVLAAPVWTKGSAKLETLAVGKDEMVRAATETVDVDLAGVLGASMNLTLDRDGAALFWSSFQSAGAQQIPILVAYELTYRARVSARMDIVADRSTLEDLIWKQANPIPHRWVPGVGRWIAMQKTAIDRPGLVALRAQNPGVRVEAMVLPQAIQQVLQQNVTNGTIQCNIATDEAGGDDKVQEALFKVATEVLSGRVIPALFGETAAQPTADDEKSTTTQSQMVLPQGQSSQTHFEIHLTSTSTIERTCNPNGALDVLVPDGAAFQKCFVERDLDDDFFATTDVVVCTAGVDFKTDGVQAILVVIDYSELDEKNPLHQTVSFHKSGALLAPTDQARFHFDLARAAAGGFKRGFRYQTQVNYADPTINGGQPVVSDWLTSSDSMLLIRPSSMGAVRVGLSLTAPKEQVRHATVTLRTRRSTGDEVSDAKALSPDLRTDTWFKLTGVGGEVQKYDYQIAYDLVPHGRIVIPWASGTSATLEVPGPFVDVRSFVFRPQGSFANVQSISLDAVYEDPAHDYRPQPQTVTLDKPAANVTVDVPIMDGGPETIRWQNAFVNYLGGAQRAIPDGSAPAGTAWIGIPVDEYLNVQVRGDLLDFDKDVKIAVITLTHLDASGQPDSHTSLTFTKASPGPQSWSVPLKDGAPRSYQLDALYVGYDGARKEVKKSDLSDEVLLLDRSA